MAIHSLFLFEGSTVLLSEGSLPLPLYLPLVMVHVQHGGDLRGDRLDPLGSSICSCYLYECRGGRGYIICVYIIYVYIIYVHI
jgi:hypothetical protein